jgi:hypothetical protein
MTNVEALIQEINEFKVSPSIEDHIEELAKLQATNEQARRDLAVALAELPVSNHGKFEWHDEDWGVEVHWNTLKEMYVFSAHSLVPHKCDDECNFPDCYTWVEKGWDYVPLKPEDLTRAIFAAFQARLSDLKDENERLINAVRSFQKKEPGSIRGLKDI